LSIACGKRFFVRFGKAVIDCPMKFANPTMRSESYHHWLQQDASYRCTGERKRADPADVIDQFGVTEYSEYRLVRKLLQQPSMISMSPGNMETALYLKTVELLERR
jgi:hypothetical protein